MSEDSRQGNPCQAGCSHCHDNGSSALSHGHLNGWRLGLAAACGFLLPLALALAGAVTCPSSWEWAGCVGGLMAGVIMAWTLGRRFRSAAEGDRV